VFAGLLVSCYLSWHLVFNHRCFGSWRREDGWISFHRRPNHLELARSVWYQGGTSLWVL